VISELVVYLWVIKSGTVKRVWTLDGQTLLQSKRDNNYWPHPLTPTSCLRNDIQLRTGISPCCGCL